MLTHSITRWLTLVLAISALSTGCSRSGTSSSHIPGDLAAWAAEVDSRAPRSLPPLPPPQRFERAVYAAQTLRDPFTRPLQDQGGGAPGLDSGRSKERLEEFSLDSLAMVGTIRSSQALVGVVAAPDKVIYRVRPGSYLGQNDGRVTAVYPDRIELVEMVTDGAGGWLERPATIGLKGQ